MSLLRDMTRETIKALAVLALAFLSFVPLPQNAQAFAEGDIWIAADATWCGQALQSHDREHEPCHACRPGLVPLPCPPDIDGPAFAALGQGAVLLVSDAGWAQAAHTPRQPRAPPA